METIDLDNLSALRELDPEGMLAHVAALPQQCRDAWDATQSLELPTRHLRTNRVLIAGMGGSAIGGDLAAAVAAAKSPFPILVHRDYELPAHVDRRTLVIASSYSGDTEETLATFEAAHGQGCPLVAVTTGGMLSRLAKQWNAPLVTFDYQSQPRAALGHSFVSLLGVLKALGVIGSLDADLEEALNILETQAKEWAPEAPQTRNAAKQMAQQLVGRIPIVVGAGPLVPVARRWKTQFNENAKAWAFFEALPEMDHNALSGIHYPEEATDSLCALFLSNTGLHPRNQLRLDLTRQIFEAQGIVCH
ncbi:MAG: bifunctional phosphoglucose/phosphomannose isomerase, partial [Anaerolineae bacterium]